MLRFLIAVGITLTGGNALAQISVSAGLSFDIFFSNGSDALSASDQENIIQIVSSLNEPENSNLMAIVTGHTSATGSFELNERLSASRSGNIERLFVESGLDENRVQSIAFGFEFLRESTDPSGSSNRRATVYVINQSEISKQIGYLSENDAIALADVQNFLTGNSAKTSIELAESLKSSFPNSTFAESVAEIIIQIIGLKGNYSVQDLNSDESQTDSVSFTRQDCALCPKFVRAPAGASKKWNVNFPDGFWISENPEAMITINEGTDDYFSNYELYFREHFGLEVPFRLASWCEVKYALEKSVISNDFVIEQINYIDDYGFAHIDPACPGGVEQNYSGPKVEQSTSDYIGNGKAFQSFLIRTEN